MMRKRRLHARIAYVMRLENRAYAAVFARGQYSRGHDAHKPSTMRLHARLAYVVRVDNRTSVAHVAATPAV
jgi:hypothetical protein